MMVTFDVVVVLFHWGENFGIFEVLIALYGCKESCGIVFSFSLPWFLMSSPMSLLLIDWDQYLLLKSF